MGAFRRTAAPADGLAARVGTLETRVAYVPRWLADRQAIDGDPSPAGLPIGARYTQTDRSPGPDGWTAATRVLTRTGDGALRWVDEHGAAQAGEAEDESAHFVRWKPGNRADAVRCRTPLGEYEFVTRVLGIGTHVDPCVPGAEKTWAIGDRHGHVDHDPHIAHHYDRSITVYVGTRAFRAKAGAPLVALRANPTLDPSGYDPA